MEISEASVAGLPLPIRLIGLGLMLFFAILFVQSGMDKALDFKGNRDWLVGQFSKSLFNGFVPLLLIVLTVMEIAVGLGAIAAGIFWMIGGELGVQLAFGVAATANATLLMLFLGQRVAKDYGGAAGIVPYFIVSFLSMLFFAAFLGQ